MDEKQNGLIPEFGDSQMSHSWAPQTPAKPGQIKLHQICTEPQEYGALHTIRVESDDFFQKNQIGQSEIDQTRNPEGFLQEGVAACLDSENVLEIFRSFNNWEVHKAMETEANENNLLGSKFDVDDGQMPFLELLAKVDNTLSTKPSGNCSLVNDPGDGSCLSINLNLPSNFFEVAPVTPEKTTRNDGRRGFVMHNLSPDEILSTKDMQQKEIHIERVESEGFLQKKERSQLVTNDVNEANSMQLEENHKPDKGGTEDVDLSKMPQQKPRRRKHRPKVIIEGQSQKTPKVIIEGQSQKTPKRKVGRPPGPQGTTKGKRKGVNNSPTTATPPETQIDGKDTNANNAPSSQETTTGKRKYVRRNTKATTPEAEIKGKDTNSNAPSAQETTTGKRKYVKRKGVNKHAVSTPDEETRETTEPKMSQKTRTTCKRSLNFDIEVQVRDESSLHQNPPPNSGMESQAQNFNVKDQSGSNTQYAQGSEATMRKTEVNSAYDLTFPTEQEMEGYLSKPEGPSSPSPHSKTDTMHYKSTPMDQKVCTRGKCEVLFTDKTTPVDQKVCTRGKCQILFTDKTVDGEGNNTQLIMKSDAQSMQKSPSDSGSSSSTACLTEERIERGQKRQHIGTTVEAEPCRLNSTGILYNSMQAYNAIFPQNAYVDCIPDMHFPAMYSTKRIEKVQNSVTSSVHSILIAPENHAMAAADDTQNKQKRFKYLSDLGPTERLDKGKSKEPALVWDLESIPEILGQLQASAGSGATTSKTTLGFGILQQPRKKKSKERTHDPKDITADASALTVTKKRPKKSLHINSTVQHMHADHHFVARSMGPPLALTWMCNSLVDAIARMTEQFNQLDLNAKSGKEHDAFTANYMDYQEQHALVPYQRNGALIPFGSTFDQVKRSRPRPKVDIDDETSRVWRLLLENINNEGIDGTDEEKEKWWEEERRVFRGRADSFIARMHLVQGDRRFSPWKGSVLDSVVGVFLTQNVSDHLSSSAFMSLAARFPFKSESSRGQSCEEKVNSTINGPEVHDLDTDDTFGWNEGLNKTTCSEVPKMLNNDTGEVNNVRFPGDSFIGALSKDNLSHQLSDISKNAPDTSRESAVNKIGLIGDEKDLDDTLSSQNSVISSQNSADSVTQSAERPESFSPRTLEAEPAAGSNSISPSTSDQKPSQNLNGVHNQEDGNRLCNMDGRIEQGSLAPDPQNENENLSDVTCSEPALHLTPTSGVQAEQYNIHQKNGKGSNITDANEVCDSEISGLSAESATPATIQKLLAINPEVLKISSEEIHSSNHHQGHMYRDTAENPAGIAQSVYYVQENNYQVQEVLNTPTQNLTDITGSSNIDNSRIPENKEIGLNLKDPGKTASEPKAKGGRTKKEKPKPVDWDSLRKQAQEGGRRRERTANTMDSVDWEAVRCAHVSEIAETIKERGMNNVLAGRIQDFLNRLVRDHGSTDLEWLRDVPPDKAKEYLLSVRGLGLKSVECVRLLTLHHLAFPVDTNVGRIAVRLGWVPLQPLPESLQLHLLELYPVLESIQQYLWPRLCKLDQRTLYELHYQMITFGKVFCTKSKPNCNACPMRGECRHFASAFASARLALPGTEEKSIMSAVQNNSANQNPVKIINPLQLPLPQANQLESRAEASNSEPIIEVPATPEPTIEVPASPEPDQTQAQECDIEDNDFEDPDDIPTIQLNMEQFTHNLQSFMQNQMELQEGDMSKALVALTPEAASIPVPKLKNVSRLRTEHQVYELPDSHPLLQMMDRREPDDPCSYLLAIWTPGETADSIQPPEGQCISQDSGNLCTNETCFSCNSIREGNSQTVRGTLLIPCRTAMRGSFPLNGTYFQVNEVFADHESSLNPINVPREWLWNLPRRTVYFGTSIPTIFKGLSTEGIQYCFWRGFVCVRGFDSKTRAPRPLIARLHFPASKLAKAK